MKRNANHKLGKLSAVLCLAVTLIITIASIFAVTASAAEQTATLSFSNKSQRTSYSTTKQVWEQNGITFTNDKSNSTNDVADYANPVRLYAKSKVTITAPGAITKIVATAGSSSYATALKNSAGAEATASGSSVTIVPTSSSESYVISSLTAQVRLSNISVTYKVADDACKHENTTQTVITEPNCGIDGKAEIVCDDCGETIDNNKVLPATGDHQDTVTKVTEPTCGKDGAEVLWCNDCETEVESTKIPATGEHQNEVTTTPADCENNGSIVTECTVCGTTSTETIPALGHMFINGKCIVCGKTVDSSIAYVLVNDVSELKAGDVIVIVASTSNYALSTTQNGNNRGQAAVTKDGNTVTFGSDVQSLTLEAGNIDGTFAFYTGSGYLYAASSSSNYLRTETTLSANSSWKITIVDGVATVVAQGSNSRNTMQYNQTSSLFACYSSATQKAISIYKQTSVSECPHNVEISAAQVSLGESLAMKYHVDICDHLDSADFSMLFTMNDNEVLAEDCVKAADGKFVFTFSGIAPQAMGDNIKAELIYNNTVVDTKDEYSVKQNLVNKLADADEKLATLISDTLAYGAAAQLYRGYKTDALVTDGVEGLTPSEAAPETSDTAKSDSADADVSISAAGVKFDFNNQLYIKITNNGEGTVTVLANGEAVEVEAFSGNVYIAYSAPLMATELTETTVTFSVLVDGTEVQTLTYSIGSYVFAKMNQTEADGVTPTKMAALAIALYRYGASAAAYAN